MSRAVPSQPALPIDEVLTPLREALAAQPNVVLQAPPGAGKTTRVPLALRDADWLEGRRIVMLEPRRLAARAAARFMAASLGESVGGTVGFRTRGDTRIGPRTRIEVVTEGVLTRMLHRDPTLEQVGVILFDEFHERSLHADVGLALALESQSLVRPDLRLLVMSATLDGTAVAALLGGAATVRSEGRAFPVVTHYRPRRVDQPVEGAVASAVAHVLDQHEGSVLVFLPGVGEIRRTKALLDRMALPRDVRVLPLFGAMTAAAQDEAIAAPVSGSRKVVLATSIAETSLTIEGVRVVIDAGLSRIPSFSARIEHDRPEMLDADLTPLALDLALAGIVDAGTLRWLDTPPAPALAHARELLQQLGALSPELRVTEHGRSMARLGTHPRLAHMLLRGRDLGLGATACAVAALLEERDAGRGGQGQDVDVRARVSRIVSHDPVSDVDRDGLYRMRAQAQRWRRALGVDDQRARDEDVGLVVALAFPDRVAQRRAGARERFLLRNGLGAELPEGSALSRVEYLAVAEVDGRRPHAGILLAAPLSAGEIEALFADQIIREDVVEWKDGEGVVTAVRRERLGALVLRESVQGAGNEGLVAEALLRGLTSNQSLGFRWPAAAQRTRERLAFLHAHVPGWPDVADTALIASAHDWLLPHLTGLRRRDQVEALDLSALLLSRVSWQQRAELDRLAPVSVEVPSGSSIRVDYSDPLAPVLAVRLQELFGLTETPAIAGGEVRLTLHLLSPAHRPVQVTRDLAGFWQSSYFEVRRELRGRYPKHEWPDDPLRALPTRRAKRRS
ncbi:MAG: ATP-dependent helicase HrpB [Gemmatimonadetes bacterium]|nr:ATP-dependent helicase HrpB [Gemmatimonadota bacterium]